ncbi:hypothetical protein [Hymenobacter lucidus]|uniref:Lipocalin-like domain-containing protein n=1 Tax=Hymenobacter lucidus TaxID=2880930 RepID=A0ABS8AZC7_9BACT|nr:hypothetical protein [Hymenobacter lucidus]MCB2411161.1 hypothetical protein [Hymenobacter lucidus]
MSRLLSLSLFCLTLATVACKKDSTPPEPALEGRWTYTDQTDTWYSSTGSRLSQGVYKNRRGYVVYTNASFQVFDIDDQPFAPPTAIKRDGSKIILVDRNKVYGTITELTDHKLKILEEEPTSTKANGDYQKSEVTYSR